MEFATDPPVPLHQELSAAVTVFDCEADVLTRKRRTCSSRLSQHKKRTICCSIIVALGMVAGSAGFIFSPLIQEAIAKYVSPVAPPRPKGLATLGKKLAMKDSGSPTSQLDSRSPALHQRLRALMLQMFASSAQEAPSWNKEKFDRNRNIVFVDIDDTIINSRQEVYPRALEFINMLSVRPFGQRNTTGNLFVATARQWFQRAQVTKLFHMTLQKHQPDRLTRDPLGFLWGSKSHVARLARKAFSAWAKEVVRMPRDTSTMQVLREHYEALGNVKYRRIKQQVLEVQGAFPQYRQSSVQGPYAPYLNGNFQRSSGRVFFVGDNGQGDLHAGAQLLQDEIVDYVFIHDVRNLKNVPLVEWSVQDPEAAGEALYRNLPEKLRNRIVLFHNYEEAIQRRLTMT